MTNIKNRLLKKLKELLEKKYRRRFSNEEALIISHHLIGIFEAIWAYKSNKNA